MPRRPAGSKDAFTHHGTTIYVYHEALDGQIAAIRYIRYAKWRCCCCRCRHDELIYSEYSPSPPQQAYSDRASIAPRSPQEVSEHGADSLMVTTFVYHPSLWG
jgi:hypothetical protein